MAQREAAKEKPGKIHDWRPSPAYISENRPERRTIVYKSVGCDRRRSARGDAARESLSEFVATPWQNYFDDVDFAPIPSALLSQQTRKSTGNAPSQQRDEQCDDVKVRRATAGPYVATTTRRLTANKKCDVELYQVGAERSDSTAKVLFPFRARSERELSVEKDDLVKVLEVVDDKWVECQVRSKVGLLP